VLDKIPQFFLPLTALLVTVTVFIYTSYAISRKGGFIQQMTEVSKELKNADKRVSILEEGVKATQSKITRNVERQFLRDMNQILLIIEGIDKGIDRSLEKKVNKLSDQVKEIIEDTEQRIR